MTDTDPVTIPAPDTTEQRREAWQRLLLPLIGAILVVVAIFFAVTSVLELRDFYGRVEQRPPALGNVFEKFEQLESAPIGEVAYLRFKVAAMLEADALHRRYHQATSTMLARVWTRHLGFLTGMLLAIVGAAFILGRFREDQTRIEGEGGGARAAIATSSPGLALSTLGTVLMAITLVVPFGVKTYDEATYLQSDLIMPMPPPGALGPITLDDPGPAPGTGAGAVQPGSDPSSSGTEPADPGAAPVVTGGDG